jgi:hypothetical protein
MHFAGAEKETEEFASRSNLCMEWGRGSADVQKRTSKSDISRFLERFSSNTKKSSRERRRNLENLWDIQSGKLVTEGIRGSHANSNFQDKFSNSLEVPHASRG